ncbi:MAG: hypothetical protein DRN96_00220 [Thermoproteota archaeon]|nr:MAG: hypothetical protein DRN96_00220 [Candidatus Korarchaeota archaeon]RLG54200.1 MAG: hypothetical protein DRN99_05505 [Candidatus Korarchaeota archaeon]
MLGSWLKLIRANFLLLTPVVYSLGIASLLYDGIPIDAVDAALALVASILSHMSVNVLNNYFDYKSGIDLKSRKTPFSGGVDVLARGEISPRGALALGLTSGLTAAAIGAYYMQKCPKLIGAIVAYAAACVTLYTPVLSHVPALSEVVAGTGFSLMCLWAYVVQARALSSTIASLYVFSSILVGVLLLLNEFPDMEVDKEAGRRHTVVLLGRGGAARVYAALVAAAYITLIAAVAARILPLAALLALATAPLAVDSSRRVLASPDSFESMLQAMARNLAVVLLSIALASTGLSAAALL